MKDTFYINGKDNFSISNPCIYLTDGFLENENSVKLLEVKIDRNLAFNPHVSDLLRKVIKTCMH